MAHTHMPEVLWVALKGSCATEMEGACLVTMNCPDLTADTSGEHCLMFD